MTTTPTIDLATQTANTVDVGPSNDDQFEPKTVALDDGRFVVIWTDNSDAAPGDAAGRDILAQAYDAFGNAIGSATRVNDGWFNDREEGFSVAALPGGKFVIAYEDTDLDGTSIRATEVTLLSDNSMTFANRSILSDPGADILSSPTVTGFSDGSYMVVYSNSTASTSTNAYGKVVSSSGSVSSEFPVLTGSDDVGNGSNGSATLVNGNAVTVHAHRVKPDGDYGVFMRILSPTGSSVLGATEVAGTSGDTDTDTQPTVAALAGGGFVVVWTNGDANDDDILFQIYDSSGTEVGGVGAVDSLGATENYNEPTVIGLKDGGFVVAYDDDDADAIKARRFDSSGNAVGSSFTIADTAAIESAPHLALTDDGRVIATWLSNTGGNNDIKMAIYDPRESTIDGDAGDNVILGRLNDASTINGLDGSDQLYGRNSNDTLDGGDDDDTLDGGDGNDILYGGKGDDKLFGGADNDNLSGYVGNDTLAGQIGNDTLGGGGGDDKVFGNGGDDKVNGGSGNDTLTASAGDDTLNGGSGNDEMFGNAGADKLIGDVGNDKLVGLDGNDSLYAGQGDDTLKGGQGDDSMSGGAGADLFVFETATGADVVSGYSSAQGDQIELKGIVGFDEFADVQAAASQVAADVVINLGGGDSVTLLGVNLGDLQASDFIFS